MKRLALWVACATQLLVVLDVSVVNVALPSMQRELGIGSVAVSWVAAAYSLAFAGFLLVGARLADVVGTARVLGWAVALFVAASVVGGSSVDEWTLVAARGGQGLAAAVASPATFTLLTRSFSEGTERVRAVAVWTAVSLAGGGVGNIVSGVLTEAISWRATFLINVPAGVCVCGAALVLQGRIRESRVRQRIDLMGAVLATGAITSATFALSMMGDRSSSWPAVGLAAVAVVLFAALAVQQRRSVAPLVPRALLADRTVVVGNVATALAGMCFQVSLWFFLTYRMQDRFGYSPIQAGLGFVPLTVTTLVVNLRVVPQLLERYRAHALIAAGAATATVGVAWLATVEASGFVAGILGPSVLLGVGGGLLGTPLATVVTTGVRAEDAGAASGLMNVAKQFGGAVGFAAASGLAAVAHTDRAAFMMMAFALVCVAACSALLPRSPVRCTRVGRSSDTGGI